MLCPLNYRSFGTKLGLMVQHHKQECLVDKLGYSVQSEGSALIQCVDVIFLFNPSLNPCVAQLFCDHHEAVSSVKIILLLWS